MNLFIYILVMEVSTDYEIIEESFEIFYMNLEIVEIVEISDDGVI